MNKQEVFKAMAQDFKESVRGYRSARRKKDLKETKYWANIIISKIEVIGEIGGFDMMQEFAFYLSKIDNDGLNLESAFCCLADGICGWSF